MTLCNVSFSYKSQKVFENSHDFALSNVRSAGLNTYLYNRQSSNYEKDFSPGPDTGPDTSIWGMLNFVMDSVGPALEVSYWLSSNSIQDALQVWRSAIIECD